MDTRDDSVLLRALAEKRDTKAFDELYERHKNGAYNLALRFTHDSGLADDALQEAMLFLWQNASRFSGKNVRGLIMSIVASKSSNLARSRKRGQRLKEHKRAMQPIEPKAMFSEKGDKDELVAALGNHIDLLPDLERQILACYYGAEMKQEEIAALMAIPQKSISRRLQSALDRLRVNLTEAGFASALPLLSAEGLRKAILTGHEVSPGLAAKLMSQITANKVRIAKTLTRRAVKAKAGGSAVFAGAAIAATAALVTAVAWFANSSSPAKAPSTPVAVAPVKAPPTSVAIAPVTARAEAAFTDRWVYSATNLWVNKSVDELEVLMRRAAKAQYTGLLLTDPKLGKLDEMDAHYFINVERVKKLARELNLEIIPSIFSLGYSESILWHNPNLAEALPVKDAPFVVKGGEARLAPDVRLLKKFDWKDDSVAFDGKSWTASNPGGKNARFAFNLKVQPFRQYHVSVKVKTQDFKGEPEVKALAGNVSLNFASLGVKPTEEWTEHHAVFNSLEHAEVSVIFGCWNGQTGMLAWKDARIEETGLLNVVRRPGAPLVVARETGEVLAEGKDFERVADPRMGCVPWKGNYEIWHEPPAIKTSLPDGTRLKVSFYQVITTNRAVTPDSGQVMICPSEPKTLELLKDEAQRVHKVFGAKKYLMAIDEIRVFDQCEACRRRKLDAGPMLAELARQCVKILRDVNPGGKIYVWSDMFDPNHNARKDYCLVRGDLAGSWEGLDKDVCIVAWDCQREKTLAFFSERGHPLLIAGYYDGEQDTRQWLEAAKKAKGVTGIMYTTWQQKFDELENFSKTVSEFYP
jgi:RNA polymerase sigma factor (sigma-70 family)